MGRALAERLWAPPAGTVDLGEVAPAVYAAVPLAAWRHGEEHQVGHQGHCPQHDLRLQAHPQEDRAGEEGQDAAAGIILGDGGTLVTKRHLLDQWPPKWGTPQLGH